MKTSTDADLDAFGAVRGVCLLDSDCDFAKTLGRCEIGDVERFPLAAPGCGGGSASMFDLADYDTMMQGIARDEAEDAEWGESNGYGYGYANIDIAARLVFLGSDGGDSHGFDPTLVTNPATSECSIDLWRNTPANGCFRQAPSPEELLLGQTLTNELPVESLDEREAAGSSASRQHKQCVSRAWEVRRGPLRRSRDRSFLP